MLVPGLGCASWMYAAVSRQLASACTVYTYDPPGHGFSQGRSGYPRTIEDLTDHLAAWLEATGLRRVALLGHSLGGEVVFDLAARYPQVVSALVACAPTGIPENPRVGVQLLRLALDAPREPPALLPLALAAYLRCGPARIWRLAQDQQRHKTGPLLPHVRAPTLLLDGTRDPVIQAWTLQALCQTIPHARVCRIPQGTHALTASFPCTVARSTLDFLSQLGG